MAALLMIDDNPQNRVYMERVVRLRTVHRIAFAQNSKEAVERLVENRPDIIFLDLFLPGTDGFQLFDILRRHPATDTIPIVIHTAVPLDPLTELRLRRIRHDGLLEFPIEATALNKMIDGLLTRRPSIRPWHPPEAG